MVEDKRPLLVMGAAMDGGALKEAALAHVKAIGSGDARGVTTQAGYPAVSELAAPAPTSKAVESTDEVQPEQVMPAFSAVGVMMPPSEVVFAGGGPSECAEDGVADASSYS